MRRLAWVGRLRGLNCGEEKMPSLNKFLKLKAGVRAGVHSRVVLRGVKIENQRERQVQKEKWSRAGAGAPCSRLPSFVSSFSTTTGAGSLHLKHGSDTGLTAVEALSRVVATPSVHRPFVLSSQRVIDDSDLVDWQARRCRVSRSVVNGEPLGKRSLGELNKCFGDKLDRQDDGAGAKSCGFGLEDRFEKRPSREVFHELWKAEKVEPTTRYDQGGGEVFEEGTTGLPPSKSRLRAVQLFLSENAISPFQFTAKRALHDVNLAGEGLPSERSSENEIERSSDESVKDGESLRLLSGACNLPHPDKVQTGGEDAFFICPERQVIGVADGVGGWADLGIDAGEYARELMAQSMIAVQLSTGCIYPLRLMEKAHSMTKCLGSSTACILSLSESVLEAANLGDSGFVIVRNSRPIFKSPVQQHEFNIPFQLESDGSDPPSAAQVFSIPVSVGDVIIVGTDGLFDNLYDSELTTVVVQAIRGGMAPEVTASKIAKLARDRAQDKNRQTPFSTAAQDAGYRFYGGKMDDITVIVSYITNNKSSTSRL